MAQHDMNIANQGFPATRADINNALQALASNNSGTSAPSTTFANQWWYDTTNNKLYIRNEANNAWIEFAVLDQANNEWQITTGVIKAKDSDGLVLQTDDGTARISIADSGNVTINDGSGNADFRVESDGNTHMLFVDANEECVSVGTSSTSVSALNVFSSGTNTAAIAARGNGSANGMTLFGDLYTDDENQITLGVGYANANAVLARGCKPHNSQSNAFLSSQDTYATRPSALSIEDGGLTFRSTTSSAATTTNSAVTLYNYFEMDTTQTVFNEDSINRDFRVESDSVSNMLQVDAGQDQVSINRSAAADSASGDYRVRLVVAGGVLLNNHRVMGISNPNGKVFTFPTSTNGTASELELTCSHSVGFRKTIFYCRNAGGNWQINAYDIATGGSTPTFTVSGSGTANPTITVVANTSYSGGFLYIKQAGVVPVMS